MQIVSTLNCSIAFQEEIQTNAKQYPQNYLFGTPPFLKLFLSDCNSHFLSASISGAL
jgi:hypothetical protein